MKLIRLLKKYGDHNFTHIINKAAYRACRARRACLASRDRRVALVATCCCRACCTACATKHVRLFPTAKCTG